MTSTDFRASRRGMALLHQYGELVEEVHRVVRARGGLGVVLDGERGPVDQADALDHAVVQVHVGDLGGPVRRAERLAGPGRHVRPAADACRADATAYPPGHVRRRTSYVGRAFECRVYLRRQRGGEAVVVARDVDTAAGQVHHRLVHAPVAVAELVGVQ